MTQTPSPVFNEFLEHALVSKYNEHGDKVYELKYPWTSKFYYNSKTQGKPFIDIDEEIYPEDISNFIQDLRTSGITQFTLSYEYGPNQSLVKAFEENGFILRGTYYYSLPELCWYEMDGQSPTEDISQVPTERDITVCAYLFEDSN
jgi:hypothetical protein